MESALLKFICCPKTGQSLRLAEETELEALNTRIHLHSVVNQSGHPVTLPLEAALIREDNQIVYPLRDDIPLLIIEEAIAH